MAYIHAEKEGTCYTNSGWYRCFGRVTINSQDARNNTTTFKVELMHGHKSGTSTWKTWKGKNIERFIRVDGTTYNLADVGTVDGTIFNSDRSALISLCSGTYTVSHDANGNKNVDLWLGCYAYSGGNGPGTCRVVSKENAWLCTLPKIDRSVAGVTHSLNSVTTTSVKINVSTTHAIDYLQYSIDGGKTFVDAGTAPYTISNLTPNTTYKVITRVRRTSNWVWQNSTELSVTTHPNPVAMSTLAVTAITPHQITVTAAANSDNTEKIIVNCNNTNKTITGKSGQVTFDVTPETTYTIKATAYTVRSGATDDKSISATTPADAYCKIIEPTGTISAKKKMYLINTNGVKTEIKKDMVTRL